MKRYIIIIERSHTAPGDAIDLEHLCVLDRIDSVKGQVEEMMSWEDEFRWPEFDEEHIAKLKAGERIVIAGEYASFRHMFIHVIPTTIT
jgi:hypothetical protein